jgi:hypothetical protein
MYESMRHIAALLALASALTACGGSGGGSDGAAGGRTVAEGAYGGRFTNNPDFDTVMVVALEDGSLWIPFGNTVSGQFQPAGFIEGNQAPTGAGWKTTDALGFNWAISGTPLAVNGSSSAAGLAGTFVEPGAPSFGFEAAPLAAPAYVYDTAASKDAIVGDWAAHSSIGGDGRYLTVYPDGTIVGTLQEACVFSGTIAPRASGRNVFDVSLVHACFNQDFAGIAIALQQGDGHQQLVMMLETAARDGGVALSAFR